MRESLPSAAAVQKQMDSGPRVRRIAFDTREIQAWDSGLLMFLSKVVAQSAQSQIELDREGLPCGVRRLLALAEKVPERKGARTETAQSSFFERIGKDVISSGQSVLEMCHFLGEVTLTFIKLLRMKARYRTSDLLRLIQDCGVQALPIVTLISFLVGVILAFVGAIQLQQFGGQI